VSHRNPPPAVSLVTLRNLGLPERLLRRRATRETVSTSVDPGQPGTPGLSEAEEVTWCR
jgi:hypothetical protein